MSQMRSLEEAMVRLEITSQRLCQLLAFRAHPSTGKFGHRGWGKFSLDQSMQHVLSRGSHHIAGDRCQLDIGILQRFLKSRDDTRALFDQRRARTGQVTQGTLPPWWDKTRSQKAMLKQ